MKVTKNRILVRPDDSEQVTAAGILFNSNAQAIAEVIQVGDGVEHVKVGDRVRHHDLAGTPVDVDGVPHLILSMYKDAGEVIAVL